MNFKHSETGAFFISGGENVIKVKSNFIINRSRMKELTSAAVVSLEQTGEALHTEVVQAQVMPRDTGALQNESTYVDKSESSMGKVSIVSSAPYARRLYFHPEYNFSRDENIAAGGKWFDPWLPGGTREDFCGKAFARLYRRNAGLN